MHSGADDFDRLRAEAILEVRERVRCDDVDVVPWLARADDVDIAPPTKQGATWTFGISSVSTSNNANLTTAAFTPAINDLLVGYVVASGVSADGTLTDSQSGTYVVVASALKNSSADRIVVFVRTARVPAASSTTATWTRSGNNTGVCVSIQRVSGMVRTGAGAVRQSKVASNQAGGGTPSTTFDNAALTGNATSSVVGNGANPGAVTTPTSWTRDHNNGYSTPATGICVAHRNSGFTGTAITWGGTSASAFGVVAIELDTSTTTSVATGVSTTTDTALALSITKIRSVGRSDETDTALAPLVENVEGGTQIPTGVSTEASTALALSVAKIRAVTPSTETDAAQALTRTKLVAHGFASTTDSAQGLAPVKVRAPGISTETDAALSLGRVKSRAAGVAVSTDAALSLTRVKSRAAGVALTTDTAIALSIAGAINVDVGTSSTTDVALALTVTKIRPTGVALEADSAFALARVKARSVGVAAATETALAPLRTKVRGTGLSSETSTALGLTRVKARTVTASTTIDEARALARVKARVVGRADEVDTAIALTIASSGLHPAVGVEIDTALALEVNKVKRGRLTAQQRRARAPKNLHRVTFRSEATMHEFSPKDPDEVTFFEIDFADQLAVGETISTCTWSSVFESGPPNAAPLVMVGPASIAGSVVQQKISGGTVGVTYILRATITTSAARQLVGSMRLGCRYN